jgi:hypothetical protein
MTEVRNSGITNYGGYQRIEGTTVGGDTRHDATDLTPEQQVVVAKALHNQETNQ